MGFSPVANTFLVLSQDKRRRYFDIYLRLRMKTRGESPFQQSKVLQKMPASAVVVNLDAHLSLPITAIA